MNDVNVVEMKRYKTLLTIIQLCVIAISFILLWNRIRFGIDFTDESWYVAEPYIVAEGAIPYVDNWTQAPGFTLPLAVMFKLFVMINGGTEGIVYYSRVIFIAVSTLVYLLSALIIWKKTRIYTILSILVPLLYLNALSLYDLSYNTLGVMYLFLAVILLFLGLEKEYFNGFKNDTRENDKSRATWSKCLITVLSGFIIARAIIATPTVMVGWICIIILLLCCKKWRKIGLFLCGNVLAAAFVIVWCCVRGGVKGFVNGLRVFFTEMSYFQIDRFHTPTEDVTYLFRFCIPLFVVLILLCFIQFIKKSVPKLKWTSSLTVIICAMCIGVGFFLSCQTRSYYHIVRYGWFEAILLVLFLKRKDDSVTTGSYNTIRVFAAITCIFFSVYIFSSFTNLYGFAYREYWMIIPTMLSILSFEVLPFNNDEMRVSFSMIMQDVLVMGALILFGSLLIYQNYNYVYRDAPISLLTEKVDSGIWKGCFTTPERKKNVELLEHYIRDITDEGDDVLFLDQVPFAYMMNEGRACSSTTLDPMCWSYGVENKDIMDEYFRTRGIIPNKVIYIDYGRDEMLSIHGKSEFNKFVQENYYLVDSFDTNPGDKNKHGKNAKDRSSFYVEYYHVN